MFPATFTILYAEDNENDFVLLKYALAQANVPADLLFVSSGQAAIDFLQRRAAPDIVLLDLRLPGISGLDVLEWIRRNLPDLTAPVLMLTASNREVDGQRAHALGANRFAEKPSDLAGYVTFARQLGDWLKSAAPRSPLH